MYIYIVYAYAQAVHKAIFGIQKFSFKLRCLITGDPTPEEDQKVLFTVSTFISLGKWEAQFL